MTHLPWILSEWHAISSSAPHLKMDGVLFQDIYSIIDVMMKKPEVIVLAERLKALYEHLSDYENPHKVTIDQCPTQVIDIFYEAWRKEGYEGTLEFFTNLIFVYLEIIQYEQLIGTDEDGKPNLDHDDLFPSVQAVAKYIDAHDKQVYPAPHANILEVVFSGVALPVNPMSAFYTWQGIPNDIHYNTSKKLYMGVDGFGDTPTGVLGFLDSKLLPFDQGVFITPTGLSYVAPPQRYSVIGGGRFNKTNQVMYGVHSLGSDHAYYVYYNWNDKRIELHRVVNGSTAILLVIELAKFVKDFDCITDINLPSALVVERDILKLATKIQIKEYSMTALFTVIADNKVPSKKADPSNMCLCFAKMDFHDPLYSVATYVSSFTDHELMFLLDQHSLPLLRT